MNNSDNYKNRNFQYHDSNMTSKTPNHQYQPRMQTHYKIALALATALLAVPAAILFAISPKKNNKLRNSPGKLETEKLSAKSI